MKCKLPFNRLLVVAFVGFAVSLLSLATLRNNNLLRQIGAWTQRERSLEGQPSVGIQDAVGKSAESQDAVGNSIIRYDVVGNSRGSMVDAMPSPQLTKQPNKTLDELTLLLKERLSLPNDAEKIIYSKSCEAGSKILHGCTDPSCKHQISSSPDERLRNVMTSSMLRLSDADRDLIQSIGQSIPENDVIFVSASSSNHFDEMQAMFHNLHTKVLPHVKNASVVLFDIGLDTDQRKLTEEKCQCQVLTFPKGNFPKHVSDNHCYSWKPIIILATITRARKLLVWQDSSIRWSQNFKVLLDKAEKYGHQIVRYRDSNRVPAHTIKQTFNYIQEDPCTYMPYPEIVGGVQLHKNDPLVLQAVIEPWVKCALEAACICPVEPDSVLACKTTVTIYRCHRFDQSALSIILARLYGDDMYKILAPEFSFLKPQYVTIARDDQMPFYFRQGSENLFRRFLSFFANNKK